MGHKAQLPGKPNHSIRDPEATKQQILDAAEIEFAQQGLNGARVDAIAVRAGVAPRMIYYNHCLLNECAGGWHLSSLYSLSRRQRPLDARHLPRNH